MFTFITLSMCLAGGDLNSKFIHTQMSARGALPPMRDVPTFPFNHVQMPAHGTVHKERLYGFFDDDWLAKARNDIGYLTFPYLNGIPLEKTGKVNWKKYVFRRGHASFNFRHRIEYGYLWICDGAGWLRQIKLDELGRFEGPEPLPKAKKVPIFPPTLPTRTLWRKYTQFRHPEDSSGLQDQGAIPSYWALGPGAVPTSASSCKSFIIFRKSKTFEVWDSQYRFDKEEKAYPWLAQVMVEQENLESFDSLFAEDFHFFLRKNDYYFVTQTGKLYHAPPPKAGEKSRTMREVWSARLRPIVAIIEDAENDKVWLFAKSKDKTETQGVYFELADTIRPREFDHAKLKRVDVEGRAKTLLEYLPLIRPRAKQE